MSQRTTYIVCYDISDPRRLRRVYQTMRGYGERLQLSVFRCDLTPGDKVSLLAELDDIVHHGEDQVMLVPLGPPDGIHATQFETLGRPLVHFERQAIVV
jgi:CRISPR-associated protein Cas2